MSKVAVDSSDRNAEGVEALADEGVVELFLLVTRGHFAGLERAARQEGITIARLLRRLIRDYLAQPRTAAT